MSQNVLNDTVSLRMATQPGRVAPLLAADAFYMALVFAWTLAVPPLGRDYALMAHPDVAGPAGRTLLVVMMRYFGDWTSGYHVTGLLLLYGCMAAILLLTRSLTRGPWWLGSVAAVLFMANPVKTEAVLNITGAQELLAALFGLCALLTYVCCRHSTNLWNRSLVLIIYLAAVTVDAANIMLFAVFIVFEYCRMPNGAGRWRRLWPTTVSGLLLLAMSGQWAAPGAFDPARMFAPLYLILYPIGMLPDNVALFQAWPVLGYGVGILLLLSGIALMYKLRNPVFSFGLLGAAALRLAQGDVTVDPVTLAGGGQLLMPVALLAIAAAGGCQAMLDNPQWRSSAVRVSTFACVLMMIAQGWVNIQWIRAGRELRRFQAAAATTFEAAPYGPVAVAPDILYCRTAPLMLSASLRYPTPFGSSIPVVPLMPVSLAPPARIRVDHYSPERLVITITGLAAPQEERPVFLTPQWWRHRAAPPRPVTRELVADDIPFPDIRIPYPE